MNDFVVSLMLLGALSTNAPEGMPFWATANQFGVMPESNGGLALLRAGTSFDESRTFQWRWGSSLGVRSDLYGFKPLVDELYASARWKALRLDLGMIHPDQSFMASDPALGTLSVTAGNCMMSGNARTLPGYGITLEPWDIPFTGGRLQLSGRFGDYSTLGRRYVQGALVHNTAIYVLWHIGDRVTLSAGIDNYTLWAGTSPEHGVLPHSLTDYFRVLLGLSGGSNAAEGDRINSLGDHRGRELLKAEYSSDDWTLSLQHDIPYDDRSGMIFRNFPDGFNTLSLSFKDKSRWISDIVYEYHSTMNQSGSCERRLATEKEIAAGHRLLKDSNTGVYYYIVGGADNYCNNYEYRSGWAAYTRQLGAPLFYSRYYYENDNPAAYSMQGTWNNLFRAHHLGLSGSLFKKIPYRLVMTYSLNYGCWFDALFNYDKGTRREQPLRQFSAGFSAAVPLFKGALQLVPGIYCDAGEALANGVSASLSIRYLFKKT